MRCALHRAQCRRVLVDDSRPLGGLCSQGGVHEAEDEEQTAALQARNDAVFLFLRSVQVAGLHAGTARDGCPTRVRASRHERRASSAFLATRGGVSPKNQRVRAQFPGG